MPRAVRPVARSVGRGGSAAAEPPPAIPSRPGSTEPNLRVRFRRRRVRESGGRVCLHRVSATRPLRRRVSPRRLIGPQNGSAPTRRRWGSLRGCGVDAAAPLDVLTIAVASLAGGEPRQQPRGISTRTAWPPVRARPGCADGFDATNDQPPQRTAGTSTHIGTSVLPFGGMPPFVVPCGAAAPAFGGRGVRLRLTPLSSPAAPIHPPRGDGSGASRWCGRGAGCGGEKTRRRREGASPVTSSVPGGGPWHYGAAAYVGGGERVGRSGC